MGISASASIFVALSWVCGLFAIVVTFLYLLDKGLNVLIAGIVTMTIIGGLVAAIYAALVDGYWLLIGLIALGIVFKGLAAITEYAD